MQVAFFRQFFSSVTKVDYLTMRHGFINVSNNQCVMSLGQIPRYQKKLFFSVLISFLNITNFGLDCANINWDLKRSVWFTLQTIALLVWYLDQIMFWIELKPEALSTQTSPVFDLPWATPSISLFMLKTHWPLSLIFSHEF